MAVVHLSVCEGVSVRIMGKNKVSILIKFQKSNVTNIGYYQIF